MDFGGLLILAKLMVNSCMVTHESLEKVQEFTDFSLIMPHRSPVRQGPKFLPMRKTKT